MLTVVNFRAHKFSMSKLKMMIISNVFEQGLLKPSVKLRAHGDGDENLFSSRNSMALIIDNETLIIPLNVLIKSPLNLF